MISPADLVRLALKKVGVLGTGQPVSGEDMTDGFLELQGMIGQWSEKRFLVFHLVDVVAPTTGKVSYTVGPRGSFNVARPDEIDSAFVRILPRGGGQATDLPLQVLTSRSDYNAIALKSMPGFPVAVWYDTTFPVGTLYVWPVPSQANYELHLIVKAPLTGFVSLYDQVNLPPAYQEAIVNNLALRLSSSYRIPLPPEVTALAMASLNTLRTSNVQVPTLRMPRGLARRGWDASTLAIGGAGLAPVPGTPGAPGIPGVTDPNDPTPIIQPLPGEMPIGVFGETKFGASTFAPSDAFVPVPVGVFGVSTFGGSLFG